MIIVLGPMELAGRTDIGKKRSNNQDQYMIARIARSAGVCGSSLETDPGLTREPNATVLLVADGLGGQVAGERASALVADTAIRTLRDRLPLDGEGTDMKVHLREAFIACQKAIEDEALRDPRCSGMGTTLTLACVVHPKAYIAHVGDSRAYLLRGPRLRQLTRDHTVEEQMKQRGIEPELEPVRLHWRRILWNVVGGNTPSIEPELSEFTLEPRDLLLLCTDGITRHLDAAEIENHLRRGGTVEEICDRLVATANEKGGLDNITVVLARDLRFEGAGSAREELEISRRT